MCSLSDHVMEVVEIVEYLFVKNYLFCFWSYNIVTLLPSSLSSFQSFQCSSLLTFKFMVSVLRVFHHICIYIFINITFSVCMMLHATLYATYDNAACIQGWPFGVHARLMEERLQGLNLTHRTVGNLRMLSARE